MPRPILFLLLSVIAAAGLTVIVGSWALGSVEGGPERGLAALALLPLVLAALVRRRGG